MHGHMVSYLIAKEVGSKLVRKTIIDMYTACLD